MTFSVSMDSKNNTSVWLYCLTLVLLPLSMMIAQDAAAKQHHSKSKTSLLEECQAYNSLPSVHCGRVPAIAITKNNTAYLVFSQNGHIYFTTTKDEGKHYSAPVAINPAAEAIYDDGENRPKIMLGPKEEIFVSWTHKTPGRYSGDVRFSRSIDGGQSFSKPFTINNDRALISHRFESMALDGNDRLYLFWIDKRDKQKSKQDGKAYRGTSIFYTYSDDLGESFAPDKKWLDHSCECCKLALKSSPSGKLAMLWRHIYPDSIRDHAIAYIDPAQPMLVKTPHKLANDHWQLKGCPHQGPDMSIEANDIAHTVWFTQGAERKGLMYRRYNLAKHEGGVIKTIDASPSASRPQVVSEGNKVTIVWKRFNGVSTDLLMLYSDDSGHSWQPEKVIANTEHGSDHPDLVKATANGKLKVIASWHTQAEGLMWLPIRQ